MRYLTISGKKMVLRQTRDVYRSVLDIVDDAPQNSNELQGPITSGATVTLPDSGFYTNGNNLQIRWNGADLIFGRDWNISGAGPNYTAVTFTFDLEGTRQNPDTFEFYVNREIT